MRWSTRVHTTALACLNLRVAAVACRLTFDAFGFGNGMDDWHAIQRVLVGLGGVVPACVIACLCVIALGARGAWQRVALFLSALLVAIGIGVASKVLHYAWDVSYGLAVFRGASGHALRAAALYPAFAWIVFTGSSRRRCTTWVVIGSLVALAVAIATIDKAIHTPVEAFTGALLGAIVPILIARAGPLPPLSGRLQALLVACAIALCVALPATHYDFERRVVELSQRLQ